MAYNGSGVFNRLYSWANDKAGGIKIRADRMDAEMNGFATGLTNVICRDGQSTPTANIPMGSYKITGLGTPTAGTDAATKAYADLMLPLAGGTMSGVIAMGTNKITGLGTPTATTDAATKAYVDSVTKMVEVYNSTLASGAAYDIGSASGYTGTMFTVNCSVGGSNTFDGAAIFGTGYLGATLPVASQGVCNVSNSINWASPPANVLNVGRELSGDKITFVNTTSSTLNVTIVRWA